MKYVKRFVFILCMLCFINVKAASIYSNYNDAVSKSNKYITNFSKYKLFIDSNNKYLYDGVNLSSKSNFINGGFINTYEFNSTNIKNDSYLITGSRYFTMSENGNNVDVVDVRKIVSKSKSEKYESKVTELIIPETRVTGTGSRNNPWVFITPEFKVTIKLNNANINGKSTLEETIIGYNKTYDITPNEEYFIFKGKDGDLVCDKTIGSYKIENNKLILDDLKGNGSCTVTYRGMDVVANIVVNNGSASKTKIIGEAGSNFTTTLTANKGYAYDNVSCTNSQSASYEPKVLTINNIIKDTTCTVNYGKPNSKTFTFVANNQTYNVMYSGYYNLDLLGARGEYGGYGAKTGGIVYLNKGDTLTINTGGAGSNSGSSKGYNGGGAGQYYGGGASTVKRNGIILIAAAGGGGGTSGTAGGSGTSKGGVSVGAAAGNNGTNAGGGGSSYDYYYNGPYNECLTGENTCVGGYITNCYDNHHRECSCVGGYVTSEYGHGYGDRWFECTSSGWYGHGSGNVSCGSDQKVFSCSNPTPSGKCTVGDTRYYTNACYGYCIGQTWDNCKSESCDWVWGCDDPYWSDCKTGHNTCRGGYEQLKKDYRSGNGGSNIYSSLVRNITRTDGYNSGNGQVTVSFYGEDL